MKAFKLMYNIIGAKDEDEKEFFESIALNLYNVFTGTPSRIACGGFNLLVDTLKNRGVDFKETWKESITEVNDPTVEELYDIFAKGCYSVEAKKADNVRNGRYLLLDGLNALSIKDGVGVISGHIMDL